jgi:replicative DNA helicase
MSIDTRPAPPIDAEVAGLRVPPQSIEAEQSVLGGLLIDNAAWDRAADLLADGDFYRPDHRAIFAALGQLITAGKPADVITVHEQLRRADKAEDCGGLDYLNALAQAVPSASNLRRYAEIVRERSVLRRLVTAGDEIATAAMNTKGRPVATVLDEAEALVLGIANETKRAGREPKLMRDLITGVMDRINAAAEGDLGECWPTGWPSLDRYLKGGLRPGKLLILAARPGVGKSSASMSIGMRLARDGRGVLFLSQEMPADELTDRAAASVAGVSGEEITSGRLSDESWRALTEAVDEMARMPLWIDDQQALTLNDIRAKARRIKGLKVLVVDYLQLCSSTLTKENRTAQVGEISRGLKALSMELGICVIALSQLNREVEKRPGKRPQLSDLRDSGEIEQDADTILFLWPVEDYEGKTFVHAGMDVAKNRSGKRGVAVMGFDLERQRWLESTRRLDEFSPKSRGGDL